MTSERDPEPEGFGDEQLEDNRPYRKRKSWKGKAGKLAAAVPSQSLALFDISTLREDSEPIKTDSSAELVDATGGTEIEPESDPLTDDDSEAQPHVASNNHAPLNIPSSGASETPPEPESKLASKSVAAARTRPFFVTNRMNLIGLLSSRLIAPQKSFYKYYADLLELCPGWVPIFVGPPPASIIERVVVEKGAGAPVLVELSESVLCGQQPDGLVVYARAAAVTDIKAIHFRDKESLRKHRAHRYGNVFPHDKLLMVTPELFSEGPDVEVVVSAPAEAPNIDWIQTDRLRGAISAAMAAAESAEATAVVAGLLGASRLPEGILVPPWLSWSVLTFEAAESVSETDAARADRLIFLAAYRVLGERDRADSWSPSEAMEAVVAEVAAADPSAGVVAIIERYLRRVREIVTMERDFKPFQNLGSPYVAAKSLLMVLLRPDLGQLLEWPIEESGADETTRVVAAVLAGRLRGVARESVALRNVALDDYTAGWVIRATTRDASTFGVTEFVADDEQTSIVVSGTRLKTSPPLR